MLTSFSPPLTFASGPAASPLTGLVAVLCFCLQEESRAGPSSHCILWLMDTQKSNLMFFLIRYGGGGADDHRGLEEGQALCLLMRKSYMYTHTQNYCVCDRITVISVL